MSGVGVCGGVEWGGWTRLMGDICPGCLSVRVKDYGTRGQHRNSAHTQAHKEQTEGGGGRRLHKHILLISRWGRYSQHGCDLGGARSRWGNGEMVTLQRHIRGWKRARPGQAMHVNSL